MMAAAARRIGDEVAARVDLVAREDRVGHLAGGCDSARNRQTLLVETVERVTVFFRAVVVDDATLRFSVLERLVCASAALRPKLTRLATIRLPIQKVDFRSTFTTRGCKLLEALGHDSKEL